MKTKGVLERVWFYKINKRPLIWARHILLYTMYNFIYLFSAKKTLLAVCIIT